MARTAYLVVLCSAFLLLTARAEVGSLLSFLQLPEHDGVARVCQLTQDNFTSTVADIGQVTVVFLKDVGQQDCPCRSGPADSAELLAQVVQKHRARVCQVPTDVIQQTEPAVEAGDVFFYKGGKRLAYHGRKSPTALLAFLIKLSSTHVRVISGKLDKVAFDAVQEPKLVGFFINDTADFKVYEEASGVFNPNVHFYAVFDRTVAKHLKLDVVGAIHLHKPMQKSPVTCSVNPASYADLELFINENKGTVLTRLTEHNINDPQVVDPSRSLVLAIGEQTSPVGGYLYRLLVKTIRNNTNSTDFHKLNVLWIEPDLFPAVYLSMATLEAAGIPSQIPALGTINGSSSAWFDMTQLNKTADKTADEQNMSLLQLWLKAVLNNTLVTSTSGVQSFLKQPASQTVAEGSDFLLECHVSNPIGDCLWLHNGQNLGFNMARHNGRYNWASDPLTGDCSLKVTGARAGHQDGQWVCEMTGNTNNPTITSAPAQVVITMTGQDPKIEL